MIKCWYCNEEVTTANYCDEHIGICTKCYNSMFQGNKVVKWWIDKISELEAKLLDSKESCILLEGLRKSEAEKKDIAMKRVSELKQQLSLTEKALELACEELYDSDSISICAYCPYDIQDECAGECPQNTKVLEKYFKTKAKEMMKNDTSL